MRRFEDRAEATLRVKGSCLLTRSLGNNYTNMLTGNSNVRIADHPDVTWRSVLAQTGPVPPGTGFILGPDHHLDGIDDARGARVLPLEDALIATSWLAHRASTETRSEFAGPIVDPMEPEASHWIVADRQGP